MVVAYNKFLKYDHILQPIPKSDFKYSTGTEKIFWNCTEGVLGFEQFIVLHFFL